MIIYDLQEQELGAATNKWESERAHYELLLQQDREKIDELVGRFELISSEYEKLSLAFNEKLREIEGLKLKTVAIAEKEKEAASWKSRNKELEKSHAKQLENTKKEVEDFAQQKLVTSFIEIMIIN